MKKVRRTVLRYLLPGLAAIIVGINFQTIIASKIAGNAVPMPFGVGMSVVMSGSMEPRLKVGDLIIIEKYKDGQIPQVGDVIVYQTGSTAVVHRVIAVEGDTITTQGDANNAPDDPFDLSLVKGKVVCSIAGLGCIVLFLKTPAGILLVLLAAVFLMERSFRKEKKQKEAEINAMKAEIRRLLEEEKENPDK